MSTFLLNWLNTEPEAIVLQRDNTFAMLSWKDFNPQPEALVSLHTVAWLFILAAGIPVVMMP